MSAITEFPDEGELVIATVANVKNFGAFVRLDEYEGREGFIHVREVATGWVKYIRDHVREGSKVVVKVLRVDQSKGHIDCSLKQVNEHQRRDKIKQWKNEAKAHKLFEILAKDLGADPEEAFSEIGFKLVEEFGSLYGVLEEVAMDETVLDEFDLPSEWQEGLTRVAQENITPPYVQIGGILELLSTDSAGIEHIKAALEASQAAATEDGSVILRYLGAPRYHIRVTAPDYKVAESVLKEAVDSAISGMEDTAGGSGKFTREGGKS